MRKAPRQERSRVTIESILDAAAHILGERGWEGFTTNNVAEIAGVSIGSLYQYFPNKQSLVEAVRRRHFDEVLTALRTATDSRMPYSTRIEAFVDGVISAHNRYPAAHRVLLESAPHGADSKLEHDEFGEWYEKGCYSLVQFAAGAQQIDAERLHVSAQVLAGAVAGVVHNAARRDLLNSLRLRQELIGMVEAICRNGGFARHAQ